MVKAILAFSVDPLGSQPGIFVRYGFWPRFDGGYHRNGGANAFDLRWQFLGPAAADSGADASAWSGSIGAQYASQGFELPSTLGLDKLQDIIGYEFSRKDILVPLIFGKGFGGGSRYGGFALGLAWNLAFIEYDTKVRKLVERLDNGEHARLRGPARGKDHPLLRRLRQRARRLPLHLSGGVIRVLLAGLRYVQALRRQAGEPGRPDLPAFRGAGIPLVGPPEHPPVSRFTSKGGDIMETDDFTRQFTFEETGYSYDTKTAKLFYFQKGDNKRKRPIEITNLSDKQRILDMNRAKLR